MMASRRVLDVGWSKFLSPQRTPPTGIAIGERHHVGNSPRTPTRTSLGTAVA